MAQIKTSSCKGITLVELLLYMSIFSIIFVMTLSSIFYMQKIIQHNNQDFYIKNQLYVNLDILQQYFELASVKIIGNELNLFDKSGALILAQKYENGHLSNIYKTKRFDVLRDVQITNYHPTLLSNGTLLKLDISYLDARQKPQILTEYLIVISRNL